MIIIIVETNFQEITNFAKKNYSSPKFVHWFFHIYNSYSKIYKIYTWHCFIIVLNLNNFACSMQYAICANFLETFIIFYHSGWNSPTRPSNPSHTGTSDLQEIEIQAEFTPDLVCLWQTFQINEHSIFRLLTQSLRRFRNRANSRSFRLAILRKLCPPPREGSLVFFFRSQTRDTFQVE